MALSWVNLLTQVIIRRGLAIVPYIIHPHRTNRNLLSLGFSADGKRLAVSWDQTVRLVDAQTGIDQAILRGCQHVITGLAFHPNGQRVAAMAADGKVKVWDVRPVDAPFTMVGRPFLKLQEGRLSPDGQYLAGVVIVQKKKEIRILDVRSRKEVLALTDITANATGLVFSPDGSQVAFLEGVRQESIETPSRVEIRNVPGGQRRIVLPIPGPQRPSGWLAFTADGDRLALNLRSPASAGEREVRIYDLRTGKVVHTLQGIDGRRSIALSPDGKRLACTHGMADGGPSAVQIWDLERGRVIVTLEDTEPVEKLVFSRDGKRLATARGNQDAELWDVESGQRLKLLKGHLGTVVALAFSPDDQRLATSSFQGFVKLWDARTGAEILTLQNDQGPRGDLAFTRDGRLIRTNHQGRVKIWNAALLAPEREAEEQAASLVRSLIEDVVVRAEVIERLQKDTSLRAPVRQAALDLAARYREDSGRLIAAAWQSLRTDGRKPGEYRLAVRQAQAACALEPETADPLTTLGVAQYRQGRFAEAVQNLTRSEKISSETGQLVQRWDSDFGILSLIRPAANLAFLAMAHHQLGHPQQAQAYLDRLRAAMSNKLLLSQEDAKALLKEAERVMKGANR